MQRRILYIFSFVCVILSLVSCSSGTSPTQTPVHQSPTSVTVAVQVPPTVPAVPKGTVLYRANWSRGLDGWQGPKAWSVVGGQLVTNSLTSTSIVVPYRPTVANYAIETRVQFAQVLVNVHNGFVIYADDQPGKDGYEAQMYQFALREPSLPPPGYADIATDQLDTSVGFQQIDFVPATIWHTYRIEVQGNQATLFVDGAKVSRSTSTLNALSNGPLGLLSMGFALRVSSFTITAL